VTGDGAEPERWLYVLHGIYGAGRNWASVRGGGAARPEWGAHCSWTCAARRSQGFPPPHTVDAAARGPRALAAHTARRPRRRARPFVRRQGRAAGMPVRRRRRAALRQVWVIDSTPERASRAAARGHAEPAALAARPVRQPRRARRCLVGTAAPRPVAQWMATNLEADGGGYRWRFDLDAIEALLLSFFETDAWTSSSRRRRDVEVHLVKAEDSSVLSGAALERGARPPRRAAACTLHRVAGGHWVNAENPAAIERAAGADAVAPE
jgi:esterase